VLCAQWATGTLRHVRSGAERCGAELPA
jgi:hypothetical protein